MATGVLLTPPIVAFYDNTGKPAVGGSVLTQVGGGNAATYQDVGLTVPLPNPIPLNSRGEVSTSAGTSTQCFLTPNQSYTFTLSDALGNQLWVATYVNGVQTSITQSVLGTALWPYNAAFDGAVPTNLGWTYGDPRRFGAALDGVTDDTAALNSWASGGGSLSFPNLTAMITGEIVLVGNTTIRASRGAKIVQSVANLSIFHPVSQTANVQIYNLHFKQTQWGASAYVGHVFFDSCLHSGVYDCEFEGIQWAGVYLKGAQHCTVRGNYFHDAFPQQNLTFTAPPAAGATAATLSANWTYPSGAYTVLFTETAGGATEGRQVTFTQGSTTASWVGAPPTLGGLGANCNAAIQVQCATEAGEVVINPTPSASAQDNIIDGNFMYCTTLDNAVAIEDPYNGVLPTRNIVCNNRITSHLGYGILVYMPDTGDSYNTIIGNFIEGITGNFAFNNSSGAGIYVTGKGAGGTAIIGNTVRNCCINTANATLAPAGIGIAGPQPVGAVPIVISGNIVSDMSQYDGILVTGLLGGASISGNTIRMPAGNTTGHGLVINNCNNAILTGNTVNMIDTANNARGIFLEGLGGANNTNCTVTGNTVTGGNISQIETVGTGGGLVTGVTIASNSLTGGTSACVPLVLGSAVDVAVTGNFMSTSNNTATINQSSCTNVRYSNNRIKGGTVAMVLAGTNTGTFVDKSNVGLTPANVTNSGTGALVEMFVTAVPTSGTQAVGDTFTNSSAAAGGAIYKWVTISPGTPGAFKTIVLGA